MSEAVFVILFRSNKNLTTNKLSSVIETKYGTITKTTNVTLCGWEIANSRWAARIFIEYGSDRVRDCGKYWPFNTLPTPSLTLSEAQRSDYSSFLKFQPEA